MMRMDRTLTWLSFYDGIVVLFDGGEKSTKLKGSKETWSYSAIIIISLPTIHSTSVHSSDKNTPICVAYRYRRWMKLMWCPALNSVVVVGN
jgi:hypothetical protein